MSRDVDLARQAKQRIGGSIDRRFAELDLETSPSSVRQLKHYVDLGAGLRVPPRRQSPAQGLAIDARVSNNQRLKVQARRLEILHEIFDAYPQSRRSQRRIDEMMHR